MSKSPSKVLQTLATYLLAGQSSLHPWSIDKMDADGNVPRLTATAQPFGHTITVNARFIESVFKFTVSVKIRLFDHDATDQNGNVLSITSEMPKDDAHGLVSSDWDGMILRMIGELSKRAFSLSDDLKQIRPRTQV